MSRNKVCDVCKTINLARETRQRPPRPQRACVTPAEKDCSGFPEVPVQPVCIRVCTGPEFLNQHNVRLMKNRPKPLPPYAHGKIMWAMKIVIVAGAAYFTYHEGVWGDQRESTECLARWQEYMRSLNTRRPPNFDECGNVIRGPSNGLLHPIYVIYKELLSTCFQGIVKLPHIIKCAYFAYLEALEKKIKAQLEERRFRRIIRLQKEEERKEREEIRRKKLL